MKFNENLNGMVTSQSDFEGNSFKKIIFRLIGATPLSAVKSLPINNPSTSIGDIKQEVKTLYNLDSEIDIKFLRNGIILTESTIINQLQLTTEDTITIMCEQAGSAPYSHKTRLESDLMSGISENDLVSQVGSLADLENDLLKYFHATTLEEARALIMKDFLLDLQERFVTAKQAVIELWSNGYKIIDPTSPDAINKLNGYSKILWGYTYDHSMVEKLGIANYFGRVYETSSIIRTEYNGKHHKRELIGGFEKLKVFFKLGTHNYNNPKYGDGLEHMIQNHLGDFERWGYTNYKEIFELIKNLITRKIGIRAGHNKILYKFVDKFGKVQYLFVCYDENGDGHIMNVYGLNERGRKAYPYLIESYNNFLALIER